jgi:hypothetical protein
LQGQLQSSLDSVSNFFWQNVSYALAQDGFSSQQVFARKRKKAIPINTLGIPPKNFVREKGDMFRTKERPKEILPSLG